MSDPQADPTRAVFEIVIQGSIEAVWNEITKTDEPQGAIFNMQMHTPGLAVGAPVQMRTKNGKYTGMVGEVLEFDPPRRFVHTMAFTNYDDPPSTVEYDLEEVGDQVRFRLTVTMTKGTKSAKQMKQGGTMIVNTLKRIVETGKPSFGVRMLYTMFRVLEPFSPKACRSENWPLSKRV